MICCYRQFTSCHFQPWLRVCNSEQMLYAESQLRRVILLVSRLFSTAVYPACDPLTTALSLFQVSDLFAQSDLSWSLLLGDLSRSADVWGVAPAVPSLHEAFQSWCRLFSTAYWKSQERFYSSFVVPCENNTSSDCSRLHEWTSG